MTLMNALALATMLAAASVVQAAAPVAATVAPASNAAHLKATRDLLAAMQVDKMLNSVAGASRYANEAQRNAVYAKIAKVPAAQIYARLTAPVAKLVSTETALEMTKFYNSPYGKKIIYGTYNSGPSIGPSQGAVASAAERKEMKRPEFVKAKKEIEAADDKIRHEVFVLLQFISKAK